MTICDIQKHYADKTMSVREVTDAYLARIEERDQTIGAFLETFAADARLRADELDAAGEEERAKPLYGIPFANKDIILVAGKTASGGSRILESYTAAYSATAIERLEAAGAIVLGRTNMDEFGCGSSTESSAYGVTKNPLDLERVPGGSSGGLSAAIAAEMAPFGIGGDTGGSIRQPAALCGNCGLRPTYGAISRHGLMAMASSFDTVGIMATNVEDIASVFRVIAGRDAKDANSHTVDAPLPELGVMDVSGLRIGVPKQYFDDRLEPGIVESIEQAIRAYEAAGAVRVPLDIPILEDALAIYYVLMPAEVSSNMNRYDGLQYGSVTEGGDLLSQVRATRGAGFGDEVKRRILLGTFVLSAGYVDAYYKKAVRARHALARALEEAMRGCDVIMGPTSPTVAWKIGEKFDDPITMYLSDIYTVVPSLAGLPAISIPCGALDGLPIGLQIMGRYAQDAKVMDVAHWLLARA